MRLWPKWQLCITSNLLTVPKCKQRSSHSVCQNVWGCNLVAFARHMFRRLLHFFLGVRAFGAQVACLCSQIDRNKREILGARFARTPPPLQRTQGWNTPLTQSPRAQGWNNPCGGDPRLHSRGIVLWYIKIFHAWHWHVASNVWLVVVGLVQGSLS